MTQIVDTQINVSVPPHSINIAEAVTKLVLDIVEAKEAGATGAALVTASVSASISDLAGIMNDVAGLSSEVSNEPIGVAEAFSIAGFQLTRALLKK